MEAEVADVGRSEGIEDSLAAAILEEDLVARKNVAGAEVGRGNLDGKAVGCGEGLEG